MNELFELHRKYDSIKVRNKYQYSHIYVKDIYPSYLDSRKNDTMRIYGIICGSQ